MKTLTHRDSYGNENRISQKEYDMIEAFGYAHLVQFGINVPSVIDMCVTKAFISNEQGNHVESLRRCLNAIKTCNPYRCTPEYDSLIQL
jgi:hypothetical protein